MLFVYLYNITIYIYILTYTNIYSYIHVYPIERLIGGYANPDSALNCGSMLRECIRYDDLAIQLLHSPCLWYFFDNYVHLRNFEVASDSFNTLRDLLTTPRNKLISSEFLGQNYDSVMLHYEVSVCIVRVYIWDVLQCGVYVYYCYQIILFINPVYA